ncbi:MAG: cyclase family protein [Spirochaetes bacterium]|nr:cyclase family protein [Spirochaetota bacterium]
MKDTETSALRLVDISVPIGEKMTIWPGDPRPRIERVRSIPRGDACNLSRIVIGAHAGTHVDAPHHFFEEGRRVDSIPLASLIGPCRVIETASGPLVERRELEACGIGKGERILLKTKNSSLRRNGAGEFREDFTALSEGAAEYLVEMHTLLVGIDYLSVESFHAPGNPVHLHLLGNNVVLLEGLDLSRVEPGPWELICLPLNIPGLEGAPARAVLRAP